MATIALRENNPAGLTNAQLDANFTNLNNDKVETSYLANTFPGSTNITTLGTITAGTWNGSTIAVSRGGTGTTTSTGSGSVVLSTSPSLTTPTLGVASATSINKVAITAPATSATLTIADGKTLTASNTLTFTGTDASSVAFGAGGTVVYTSNKLSALSATTSAELAGVISDETGTGKLVFATSPTFTTSIVTDSTTFSIANTTATTLSIGGAATTISIGAATGTTTVGHNLVVTGNLTVNGTTTTINSTTIAVDDIAIELGDVATPTDATANGGGIILKGTTNKTFLWNSTDVAWNSSESINVASGKGYEIAGTAILTSTALASSVVTSSLTSVGTIGTGAWQGSVISSTYGGTGVNNGGRTITLNTGNLTLTAQSGGSSVTVPASGTLYASGQTDVALGDGGTGASLSAVNGGVVYSTASAMAITSAGTAGQALVSAGAAAPVWTTLTLENLPDAWTKRAVVAATTANITLSAPQTIDGIAVVAGNRVLVKDQTAAAENGIYVVAAGAWTRATDADTASEIAGAQVAVDQGTANGGSTWDTVFKSTDTLGTTAMSWNVVVDGGRLVTAGATTTPAAVRYNGTTATAGQFDGGTTTPTGTTRLNYGGYFYPTFINLSGSSDTTTAATHYFVETGSDGFVRPKTLANVQTEIVTNAVLLARNGAGAFGYTTGAGGTVTQATSRTTGVTLNEYCGAITLFSTSTNAGQVTTFTVTNSTVAATDVVIVNHKSGGTIGAYIVYVSTVAAGSFQISVYTPAAQGTAAPILQYAVVKGVNA